MYILWVHQAILALCYLAVCSVLHVAIHEMFIVILKSLTVMDRPIAKRILFPLWPYPVEHAMPELYPLFSCLI